MRTIALIVTATLTALSATAGPVPRPSPELIFQRGSGPPMKLSQFRGKIVALTFVHTTCNHCQFLTRTLKTIQKDYAARNVQVVEVAFEPDAAVNYPMFLKALEPTFPTGYVTDPEVKKYWKWNDQTDGLMMIPYMVFIDAGGTIRGDFNGKDGFFTNADTRVRAELDKMLKPGGSKKK